MFILCLWWWGGGGGGGGQPPRLSSVLCYVQHSSAVRALMAAPPFIPHQVRMAVIHWTYLRVVNSIFTGHDVSCEFNIHRHDMFCEHQMHHQRLIEYAAYLICYYYCTQNYNTVAVQEDSASKLLLQLAQQLLYSNNDYITSLIAVTRNLRDSFTRNSVFLDAS